MLFLLIKLARYLRGFCMASWLILIIEKLDSLHYSGTYLEMIFNVNIKLFFWKKKINIHFPEQHKMHDVLLDGVKKRDGLTVMDFEQLVAFNEEGMKSSK